MCVCFFFFLIFTIVVLVSSFFDGSVAMAGPTTPVPVRGAQVILDETTGLIKAGEFYKQDKSLDGNYYTDPDQFIRCVR